MMQKEDNAEDLEVFIKVAADSIAELRKVDVLRVLISNGLHQKQLARYICAERPDLAQEVLECMQEELHISDW
jgi:hypothetical protein